MWQRVNRARSRRGTRFEANAPRSGEISRENDRGVKDPRPVATWFEENPLRSGRFAGQPVEAG